MDPRLPRSHYDALSDAADPDGTPAVPVDLDDAGRDGSVAGLLILLGVTAVVVGFLPGLLIGFHFGSY